MEPFTRLKGTVAPLPRVNVDTDQIIPKQFLKRIERTGYGEFLFFDWRYEEDGSERPGFELNRDEFSGARVLLAGRNFGCGSSREHAAWALQDYGIDVVVAPDGREVPFEIDEATRFRLLNGLDDIGLTLQHEDDITAYEAARGIA